MNARGGVNKRRIQYEYLDDQGIPSETLRQTQFLVQNEQVFAIFNSVGTEQNDAIRPYLNQAGVPHLFAATGATTFDRDYAAYPWTIGYQPPYTAEGAMYGSYLRGTMPNARIAILYQADYGTDLIKGLRRGLGPRAVNIVARASYTATDDNVQAQISTLRASNATASDALRDAELHDPGLPVRERARLEAEDLRQRCLERCKRDDERLEPGREQARRRIDLNRLPQGPG